MGNRGILGNCGKGGMLGHRVTIRSSFETRNPLLKKRCGGTVVVKWNDDESDEILREAKVDEIG